MRAALIRAAAAVGIALFALGLAAPRPAVAETCRHSRRSSRSAGSGDVASAFHAERVSHLARRSPASRAEGRFPRFLIALSDRATGSADGGVLPTRRAAGPLGGWVPGRGETRVPAELGARPTLVLRSVA